MISWPATIRLALLLDAFGWAVVLAQPGYTFGLTRSFDGMAAMMGEDAWAVLFVATAAVILLSALRSGWWRVGVTGLVGIGHGLLALSFTRASAGLSTGAVTHGVLMLIAWRLLGDDIWEVRTGGRPRGR